MTPQKKCCYSTTDSSVQQVIDENDYNEKYFAGNKLDEKTESQQLSEGPLQKGSSNKSSQYVPNTIDVGVQCDPINLFQDLTNRLFHKLSIIFKSSSAFGSWLRKFIQRFKKSIVDWTNSKENVCTCTAKLLALEEKIKTVEMENSYSKTKVLDDEERFRQLMEEIQFLKTQIDSIRFSVPVGKPVVGVCGPPIPPPPPPPLPKSPLIRTTIPKIVVTRKEEKKEASSRPVITAEALQSVKLKKVTDRAPNELVTNQSGGPLVTMDQLRSVKLRPRRKHQTQAFSPTRTPICRERIFKSRSPGFRKERRPRLDRIPLSAILNMDEP